MLDKGKLLRYYKRREIQEAIIEHCRDREIGVRYAEGFGKRPDLLNYPKEIIELVIKGAVSFHCSEERWINPLELKNDLKKKEIEELRKGWDLVLDIDCKFFEYSKICADLIIKFLKYSGLREVSCKFSGNKGFHIGVPFEVFPKKIRGIETKLLFPEAPRKIAFYIKEQIKKELGKRILEKEKGDFNKIKEKTGLDKELVYYEKNEFGDRIAKLQVNSFLTIDTILIAPRHLYRAPYSLHEKSGLASVVINPEKVLAFEKEEAKPEKVKVSSFKFLGREAKEEKGKRLLLQALDFQAREEEKLVENQKKSFYPEIKTESPITEEFFPPCMKLMLAGLNDGRKRAVFCLRSFLGKLNWEKEAVLELLLKWNKEKNKESLSDNFIKTQLKYFQRDKLPPNCGHEGYYQEIGVCQPNELCKKIKNPVNYALIKWKKEVKKRKNL